jgi:hypothetical protein
MRLIFLSFLLILALTAEAQRTLYPIVENTLHGYIDSTGEIVVPPRFNALQPFSEGLAAARLGGYYGYIDSTGSWVIPPQYEYATLFIEGLAIAFKNKLAFYINHQNVIPFTVDSVKTLAAFQNGLAKIEIGKHVFIANEDKKTDYKYLTTFGLLDKSGKWVIQPTFESIEYFEHGQFKVTKYSEETRERTEGVMDSLGHWIVPTGIYSEIQPFKNGYARVDFLNTKRKDWSDDGFINLKGELIFKLKSSRTLGIYYDAVIQDSVFVIRLGKKPKKSQIEKGTSLRRPKQMARY